MSGTTEIEIFGTLSENLCIAAEECAVLAWHPRRGFRYNKFCAALERVHGACEQAYYWRNYDARWLQVGALAHFVLQHAGRWLRGRRVAAGPDTIRFTGGAIEDRKAAHPCFLWLSERLTAMHAEAEHIRTAATGRVGPIEPIVKPGPHRDTKPVQVIAPGWGKRDSGLIVPHV